MGEQALRQFLKLEALVCFALPIWYVVVATVFLPVTIMGMAAGADVATVHVLCTIAGLLGLWALYSTLKYCLSADPAPRPKWSLVIVFGALGLLALWTEMTGFLGIIDEFDLNWFSALMTVPPTICAIHVLMLALRKQRAGTQKLPDA
jgi:hypothetical protein